MNAPGGSPPRRAWTWLRGGAVLLLVSLPIAVAATEVLLRLFGHASIPVRQLLCLPGEAPTFDGVGTLDDLIAVAPLPLPPLRVWSGFRLNSHGLYTGEYERAKVPGTLRVVALGDSFTFDSGMVPLSTRRPAPSEQGDHRDRPYRNCFPQCCRGESCIRPVSEHGERFRHKPMGSAKRFK